MEWLNIKSYGISNAEIIEKACDIEDHDSLWVVLEKWANFIERVRNEQIT